MAPRDIKMLRVTVALDLHFTHTLAHCSNFSEQRFVHKHGLSRFDRSTAAKHARKGFYYSCYDSDYARAKSPITYRSWCSSIISFGNKYCKKKNMLSSCRQINAMVFEENAIILTQVYRTAVYYSGALYVAFRISRN